MNKLLTFILLVQALLSVAQTPDSTFVVTTEPAPYVQLPAKSPIRIDSISCVKFDSNSITFNGADWSSFFQLIKTLQDSAHTQPNIVSIAHLGDSHVQAGFFTEAMRIPLQMEWGNAGLGLVVPLKICKTNEPKNYRITSSGTWKTGRCVGKPISHRTGVGGAVIESTAQTLDLTFETKSRYGEDVTFNKLTLLHALADSFPSLQPVDTLNGLNIQTLVNGETCYSWDSLTNTISLQGINHNVSSTASIYGAILENGNSGVLVHTIGNNGAAYESYNRIENYGAKMASLHPHLVIISLGTNESVTSTYTRERLHREMDRLIFSIKKECPDAMFLLTTPSDNKLRRRRKNKKGRRITYYAQNQNLPHIVEAIKDYGTKNHIAVWDWYTISGGKGAYVTWIKEGGMNKDHIHYTAKGYALQGTLLYQSILNAYEQHIQ